MEIPESLPIGKAFSRKRKGVALLTVLTVMALTTILVLTFFSLAMSEHEASNTYSHGIQAQQVAEQAVNLIIGQIREATNTEAGKTQLSARKAWASQPGAIRVWENSGSLDQVYKLYSDDEMKTSRQEAVQTDFSDMRSWSSYPEQYVDLNEPVIRGEKVYYPIVHPAASLLPQWPKPLDGDRSGIEGFSYDSNQMDEGVFGRKAAAIAQASDGHVAMPAMWLYQLADGTIGYLEKGDDSSTESLFVAITGGGTPTKKNQIVARMAFWGDDETSKLNLNTHAGGLAWDIPKAGGEMDMDMGRYQPAQKEWQRYPGHPATTHLGAALAPGIVDIVNDRDAMEMLYRVVPRVVGGGSESGTRLIDTRDPKEENGLVADTEPLFPSLDDMIMRADREGHEYPNADGTPIPEDELSEYLERSKFFITAYSRAPEVNMFNLPRVSVWPIFNAERSTSAQSDYQKKMTAFDRLIHYCASVGGSSRDRYDYIFRREKADSPTFDYEQIARNKELYGYLNSLMSSNIPGWGGSFDSASKYGGYGQRQILTEIFDYIRCVNLHDDTVYAENFQRAFTKKNNSDHDTFTNPRDGNEANFGFGHKGHGQVTPIRIGDTKGVGRFFTINGADVMVACVAEPGAKWPLYPGVIGYRGVQWDPPSGQTYTNLPPLPTTVKEEQEGTWPQWLKNIKAGLDQAAIPGEVKAAFDPTQWNWQLAFLDPQYAAAVMADPTTNKFDRSKLGTASMGTETRLKQDEKMVQGMFLFNLFSPSIGWIGINPDMQIDISATPNSMVFQTPKGDFPFLGFDDSKWGGVVRKASDVPDYTYRWSTNWVKPHREGGVRAWGGLLPFTFLILAHDTLGERGAGGNWNRSPGSVWWQLWDGGNRYRQTTSHAVRSRITPYDRGYDKIEEALTRVSSIRDIGGDPADIAQSYRYDLVTVPFKISSSGNGLAFNGGKVKFMVYDGGDSSENSYQDDDETSLVQEIEMEFPRFQFTTSQINIASPRRGYVNEFDALSSDSAGVLEFAGMTADPANPWSSANVSASMKGGSWTNGNHPPRDSSAFFTNSQYGNARGRMADSSLFRNGRFIKGYNMTPGFEDSKRNEQRDKSRDFDVVQSVAIPHGDARLVSVRAKIGVGEIFKPHRLYGDRPMAHSLTNADGERTRGYYFFDSTGPQDPREYLIVPRSHLGEVPGKDNPYRNRVPLAFSGDGDSNSDADTSAKVQLYGDFDNGSGTMIDGPYINKPDEGNVHALKTKFTQEIVHHWESLRNYGEFPYFSHPEKAESGGPSYFSPNRIISGPGMFGSLPTGIVSNTASDADKPWQTLLFRPEVVGGAYGASHPGAIDPPDHLIMDLFWMPVVEPYAISEPLSTAGKVNLNYQMSPYLHITRTTALRGVFRSEFMLCIPNEYHDDYKHDRGRGRGYHWRDNPYGGELQGKRLRTVILESPTLKQFDDRFDEGKDIFKSATEICEIHLVPQQVSERMGSTRGSIGTYTPTVEQMKNGKYWSDHVLVGDNSKERPYTNIQQRLTTKSNTFKVHYRAQVLKQSRRETNAEYRYWRAEVDTVQAEYRGSSIVERYVDPNDPELVDYAANPTESLSESYRYRVVNPRRFAP